MFPQNEDSGITRGRTPRGSTPGASTYTSTAYAVASRPSASTLKRWSTSAIAS
ncbi:MAG TPA: hypothetical protein VJ842_03770 [Pyrinomonadaceae bacterium]|nr:hypothetical protein [Pyrinomonadaceae bacterium]